MNKRDTIFSRPSTGTGDFKFDDEVAAVFSDMIRRSVPGYEHVITMSGLFAGRFARPGCNCYDLGCSLGDGAFSMQRHINYQDCQIIAVDNSPAMIDRCRKIVADAPPLPLIRVLEADIRDVEYQHNALTLINFTLQFLPPADREPLLKRIYLSMSPGAALILSEKISFDDHINNSLFIDTYHAWKTCNGYSEMEIKQKRNALEKVLIPETLETHKERLHRVGFKHCEVWFQCFNFVSIVAFR